MPGSRQVQFLIMRRIIYVLLVIFVLLASAAILIKPLIISLAKKNLSRIFIGSTVFIRDCEFRPMHSLAFFGLVVRVPRIYDFKIGELKVEYFPVRAIQGKIGRIRVRDAQASIDLPDKSIAGFNQYLRSSGSGVFLLI